jgi:hypothetical protein
MQKLWSSKSDQAKPSTLETSELEPSANEDLNEDLQSEDSTTEELNQEVAEPSKKFFKWQISLFWFFLALGIGGVFIIASLGLQYLTAPESNPDSKIACKSQISGDWQTPFGKVNLKEESDDSVSGKYEYLNFERGKVVGNLKGKLSNNVVTFDWQETPNQQPQQQGKGVIVFASGCNDFYGSYGLGENTNNFGNWQGSRISK